MLNITINNFIILGLQLGEKVSGHKKAFTYTLFYHPSMLKLAGGISEYQLFCIWTFCLRTSSLPLISSDILLFGKSAIICCPISSAPTHLFSVTAMANCTPKL